MSAPPATASTPSPPSPTWKDKALHSVVGGATSAAIDMGDRVLEHALDEEKNVMDMFRGKDENGNRNLRNTLGRAGSNFVGTAIGNLPGNSMVNNTIGGAISSGGSAYFGGADWGEVGIQALTGGAQGLASASWAGPSDKDGIQALPRGAQGLASAFWAGPSEPDIFRWRDAGASALDSAGSSVISHGINHVIGGSTQENEGYVPKEEEEKYRYSA